MRYYFIRQDENSECDDKECGGETGVQYNDEGHGGWRKVDAIEPLRNPDSSKQFRKWCKKCQKSFPVKLRPHDTKP
jgi:hypothetical protein